MALVQPSELFSLDYAFNGEPFVSVPAKSDIDLGSMDYAFNGEPFVANEWGETLVPTWSIVFGNPD